MNSQRIIVIAFCALGFYECRHHESLDKVPMLLSSPPQVVEGKWSTPWGWGSVEITLHAKGSFEYRSYGCTGSCFTNGTWTKENGLIVLTSLEEFDQSRKKPRPAPVLVVKSKKSGKNSKTVLMSFDAYYDAAPIYPPFNQPIYLDHQKYFLNGDTLIGLPYNDTLIRQSLFSHK